MKYLIGIDLGTSGTKTVLFDEDGKNVANSTVEYPMYQPENGWAEQSPDDWWNACVKTLQDVIKKSGVNSSDVEGIGISGQMHGLVMLDDRGKVLRNSIIWCDGRTSKECAEITDLVGADKLIEISANPALTGFTAGKILWVRKHEPEIYEKCRHILLPKDFLRYKLTGVFATEVSDASGMNLLDVPNRCWSNEILEKLEIDPNLLPSMHESIEITGHITKEIASITGLAEGTPVVGGAGDNAAAAIGTGVVESGKAFSTIGTSGVIFAHMDNVRIDLKGRVHTFCSAVPNAWSVMSCTLSAGGSLQWFRNNFCSAEIETANGMKKDPYFLMDKQAETIPIGCEKLLFLPYLMGERSPILDPLARGAFIGLSGVHTRQHMLRAVMEGVIYSLRDCLDVLIEMEVPFDVMYATGGGGTSKIWRQMMADVFEYPVATIDNREGPALGAAILAGVGTGVYTSIQNACDKIIGIKSHQKPIKENTDRYRPYYSLYKKLYLSLMDNFVELSAL